MLYIHTGLIEINTENNLKINLICFVLLKNAIKTGYPHCLLYWFILHMYK